MRTQECVTQVVSPIGELVRVEEELGNTMRIDPIKVLVKVENPQSVSISKKIRFNGSIHLVCITEES